METRAPHESQRPSQSPEEWQLLILLQWLAAIMFNGLASVLGYSRPDMVSVAKIQIHPIKSCHGTSVASARCTPLGLAHDREFMIIDAKTHKAITARDISKMVLIHPEVYADPTSPDSGVMRVSFPAESGLEAFTVPLRPCEETCERLERLDDVKIWKSTTDGYICQTIDYLSNTIDSDEEGIPSARLSAFLGRQVHLVYKGPLPRPVAPTATAPSLDSRAVFQDGYPLLVLSLESIGSVMNTIRRAARKDAGWDIAGVDEEKWGDEEEKFLLAERFRPNIVVEGAKAAFEEDSWEEIAVEEPDGSVRGSILLVSRCTRCLLPNVDPVSGVADKAVPFKVISKYRRVEPDSPYSPCVGVNGCPLTTPEGFDIHVGDSIKVVRKLYRDTLPMSTK